MNKVVERLWEKKTERADNTTDSQSWINWNDLISRVYQWRGSEKFLKRDQDVWGMRVSPTSSLITSHISFLAPTSTGKRRSKPPWFESSPLDGKHERVSIVLRIQYFKFIPRSNDITYVLHLESKWGWWRSQLFLNKSLGECSSFEDALP